jgi:hypothetical protein
MEGGWTWWKKDGRSLTDKEQGVKDFIGKGIN